MSPEEQDAIRLLNTAIIKSKDKELTAPFEERLSRTCGLPAVRSLIVAIAHLSETERMSMDQAAMGIVEAIKELDGIWGDYVMTEGMGRVRSSLGS